MSNQTPQVSVKHLETRIEALTKANQHLKNQLDRTNLLYEVSVSLSSALNFETIVSEAVGFAKYLGATSGEIHLLTDSGEVYFKSSYPERNNLDNLERQALVRRVLNEGLDAWVLHTGQLALILDTKKDERWLPIEYSDQTVSVRSAICAPIVLERGKLEGAISFVHPDPNYFDKQDLILLGTLTAHLVTALENAYQFSYLNSSLKESNLIFDVSRALASTSSRKDVFEALLSSLKTAGASQCTLYVCHGLSSNNVPLEAQIAFLGSTTAAKRNHAYLYQRFSLANHPTLLTIAKTQDPLVIENTETDDSLAEIDRELFLKLEAKSLVINPLINHTQVTGFLAVEFNSKHIFTDRELTLFRTLATQTTIALEHVRQIERTEQALAEAQTLYRAGRVLAGAKDLQGILEEALIEFVYSLGLNQGGITLITPDGQFGQLMAYLENGEIQNIETLRFKIRKDIAYQKILLSGQPFVSVNAPYDNRLAEFTTFNQDHPILSTVQAPMIIHGETIGWIGADAIGEMRDFSQHEIDLARAMADQIAIAIQNRRLYEHSERQAEQLRAVAIVGDAVTGLTDLNQILNLTVDLIRDKFGFYHVSVFLVDETREWAVVKASTGPVGKIMVERPHKLGVGSNSIVGYVTHHAKPRIALDVGEDAVHFENPLLPQTRSEMALPMVARGVIIGALDVQSVEPNAFTNDDIEILQVMTDQVTTAIETARLFAETQRRFKEQTMLYNLGAKVGSTLNLQETTDIVAAETVTMLDMAECVLALYEEGETAFIISDYIKPGVSFRNDKGKHFNINEYYSWARILGTKQEFVLHIDDPAAEQSRELTYLQEHQGTAVVIVPIVLRGRVIGLLEVYDNQPRPRITPETIALLDSIALMAANAIENARLFESARESQTFMKAIIDQIPDPIFIKDKEHKWIVVNTAFAEDILGQPEENVLGRTDYDFLPKEEADAFWDFDTKMFATGQTQQTEEPITDAKGNHRTLYTRKIPLSLNPNDSTPEYLIGIINDITDRKQREIEREQLIAETRRILERTQTLYRIGDILAAPNNLDLSQADNQRLTFEKVLSAYLDLLGLDQGTIILFVEALNSTVAQARYIGGNAVQPKLVLARDQDLIFQHLEANPTPLIIKNPKNHPLVKDYHQTRSQGNVTSMLVIPLVIEPQLAGNMIIDATIKGYVFNQEDIAIGQAIADQLTIWLENSRLLVEAQHRSKRLETAAEVSRAASSILEIDQLINTSVNLIRDQFDFYYVGLFLVDQSGAWAILHAGTGEAGRIQLENKHKLEIGGGSMIGWSIANRQAKITLDVGDEAVRFKNPILPDTRSEMALPLISRDNVIGALTVQSVERLAFSTEDITLLQTMADQLANALENARLFEYLTHAQEEAEARLQETLALQKLSQELSGTLQVNEIINIFFQAATRILGFDYVIFSLVDKANQRVKAVAGSGVTDSHLKLANHPLDSKDIMADIIRTGKTEVIEGWDERLNVNIFDTESHANWGQRVFSPITLRQENIGLIEAGYNEHVENRMEESRLTLLRAFIDQAAVALDNAQRYQATQKTAQREAIIREITNKIRSHTEIEDILKVTVTELGKVLGTPRGNITLDLAESTAKPPTNGGS